jgi:hypothetical protein
MKQVKWKAKLLILSILYNGCTCENGWNIVIHTWLISFEDKHLISVLSK